jgi:HEAT repeat protein
MPGRLSIVRPGRFGALLGLCLAITPVALLAQTNIPVASKSRVPALVNDLHNGTTPEVRRESALALGRIGPDAKEAVPTLIQALRDKDSSVRQAANLALEGMGPAAEAAAPALVAELGDNPVFGLLSRICG